MRLFGAKEWLDTVRGPARLGKTSLESRNGEVSINNMHRGRYLLVFSNQRVRETFGVHVTRQYKSVHELQEHRAKCVSKIKCEYDDARSSGSSIGANIAS